MSDNQPISPVSIPRSEQYKVYSRVENREYRIYVAKPAEEPPPGGYPVLYLLDANAVFGTVVEAIRLLSLLPLGFSSAVVVGIGYETDAPLHDNRYYDFTLPTEPSVLPARDDGTTWPETGGAEAFLNFIETELKPEIEGKFKIDRTHQTIIGFSLGGYFALHVLFTRPETFQTYLVGSPSIWWNNNHLLEEEKQFVARLLKEKHPVRVFLGVGELERNHPARMTENAEEMAARLAGLAKQGIEITFKEFEGEDHISVGQGFLSRALRFALKTPSI